MDMGVVFIYHFVFIDQGAATRAALTMGRPQAYPLATCPARELPGEPDTDITCTGTGLPYPVPVAFLSN